MFLLSPKGLDITMNYKRIICAVMALVIGGTCLVGCTNSEEDVPLITTTQATAQGDSSATADDDTTDVEKEFEDIVLQKNGGATSNSPNVTLSQGQVLIEGGGDYRITSDVSEWHGQIILKLPNTEVAELRFENVNITNTSRNIIQIIDSSIVTDRSFLEAEAVVGSTADDEIEEVSDMESAPDVSITFPTDTESTFTTSGNGVTGVLYNEAKLTIKGNGKATISATKNANNAICSTKSIKIKNVDLTLTTAANNVTKNLASTSGSAKGIFSYSDVKVESGTLTIKSNGDAIRCDEFDATGGTTYLSSSACDGIDADDAIVISDTAKVTSIALEKSAFKVRRVNNQEKIDAGDTTIASTKGIRSQEDTFLINGGTVIGESKNITTVQSASTQASITCRAVKATAGSTEESKKAIKFTISGGINASSTNACIKFLYSSSSVKAGTAYKVNSQAVTWSGTVGDVRITSVQ